MGLKKKYYHRLFLSHIDDKQLLICCFSRFPLLPYLQPHQHQSERHHSSFLPIKVFCFSFHMITEQVFCAASENLWASGSSPICIFNWICLNLNSAILTPQLIHLWNSIKTRMKITLLFCWKSYPLNFIQIAGQMISRKRPRPSLQYFQHYQLAKLTIFLVYLDWLWDSEIRLPLYLPTRNVD